MKLIWEEEPDFINEQGVKWWFDKPTTEYAHRDKYKLTNLVVYVTQLPTGEMQRVIIDTSIGQVIYENQSLESIAVHIDMLYAVSQYKDVQPVERSTKIGKQSRRKSGTKRVKIS